MSLFVPWKSDFQFGENDLSPDFKHNYKQRQFCFDFHSSPYIRLLNDSFTSKSFIDAVVKNDFDSAKLYLSKFELFVDFDEIKEIFNGIKTYNFVPVYYNKNLTLLKNEKINSVFISDKNKKLILHFFLINEPDRFSKWKIYRIEEEYVTGFFERKKLWINF